jgi:hypothetical protein
MARQIDKMEKKDYLKCLAAISVFFIFFFIPILFFRNMQLKIENMQVRENLNQLTMWAQVYKVKNKSFKGMENNYEISKIVKTLSYMGKDCILILDNDSFCVKAKVTDEKTRRWCVDSIGYAGPKFNNCDYDKQIKCE